jgi:hypothetical protein
MIFPSTTQLRFSLIFTAVVTCTRLQMDHARSNSCASQKARNGSDAFHWILGREQGRNLE